MAGAGDGTPGDGRPGWRSVLRSAVLTTLAGARPLLEPIYGGLGTILGFHSVVSRRRSGRVGWVPELEVTIDVLEDLLRRAREHGRDVLSLDQVHAAVTHGKHERPFVAFTFDDGYRDALTRALPVFERFEAPFAVYVTPSYPDGTAVLWWYPLEEKLLECDVLDFEFLGERYHFPAATPAEKTAAFLSLERIVEGVAPDILLDFARAACGRERVDRAQAELPIRWSELQELASSPLVTIGAHTLTHPILSCLSAEEVREEIVGSREVLEAKLGRAVHHFSYPYGTPRQVTARELAIERECGFDTAVTARPGNVFVGHAEHLEALPRFMCHGESAQEIERLAYTGAQAALRHRGRRLVTC
jgi:peptidoglycan/xylan/chitin deacetylase (PgdA/CDA1 family)